MSFKSELNDTAAGYIKRIDNRLKPSDTDSKTSDLMDLREHIYDHFRGKKREYENINFPFFIGMALTGFPSALFFTVATAIPPLAGFLLSGLFAASTVGALFTGVRVYQLERYEDILVGRINHVINKQIEDGKIPSMIKTGYDFKGAQLMGRFKVAADAAKRFEDLRTKVAQATKPAAAV